MLFSGAGNPECFSTFLLLPFVGAFMSHLNRGCQSMNNRWKLVSSMMIMYHTI